MSLHVYLDLEGKREHVVRERRLIFQWDGAGVLLRQGLYHRFDGGVDYEASILPTSGCSTCAEVDIEWTEDLKLALDAARWFESKSAPHWLKHGRKPNPVDDITIDITIDYNERYKHVLEKYLRQLEDRLEQELLEFLRSNISEEIDSSAVCVSSRMNKVVS